MIRHGIAGLDFHWRSDPFSRLRTGYLGVWRYVKRAVLLTLQEYLLRGFASAFCVELSPCCLKPRGMQLLAA